MLLMMLQLLLLMYFVVSIKIACFPVFRMEFIIFKSYVHYCKHGLVCDPCDFGMIFFALEAIACKQPMECACLPLCASLVDFFVFSFPLLAWLSC